MGYIVSVLIHWALLLGVKRALTFPLIMINSYPLLQPLKMAVIWLYGEPMILARLTLGASTKKVFQVQAS